MADPLVYFEAASLPTGAILPRSQVQLSPLDRGFMFGDGVYEVIRSYQGRFFRLAHHLLRLEHSLEAIRIAYPGPIERLGRIALELLQRNDLLGCDATAYIQITRGIHPRQHAFPDPAVRPTVYLETSGLEPAAAGMKSGVAAITVSDIRWHRCDIKSICLLPNVLAHQAAREQGAYEAIMIRDGLVTEGTRTNVFGVNSGTVVTHPLDRNILPGVTRAAVFELCAALSIPVSDAGLRQTELARLDELFLAGTTVEITPVVSLDGQPIGTGEPGPVTRRLQAEFRIFVLKELAPPAT